jgi:hypothetical protein
MATTTYFAALTAAIDFLNEHDFDNQEVIDKLTTLRNQKATKSKAGKKSAAREKNEELAHLVADAIRNSGETEVKAAWIRDHVDGINTTPKAVAVINVGTDLGILKSRRVEKSATRFELLYSVAE